MNHTDPRLRRGAHRTRRDTTAALVPSLLAVLAVTALIVAVNVYLGEDPTGDAAAPAGVSSTKTTGIPSASPSATPSPSQSSSASPRATKTKKKPTSSASSRSAEETAAARDIAVVVLNQSSRGGLAGAVADRLRGQGWTVAGVGNFHGVVPSTTVYYPPGAEAQAQTAAEDLAAAPRIRPRFGNLSTTRLTVVVTTSYPS